MASIIIVVYSVGIVWLMVNTGLIFTECPSDDAGIVLYNEKLYAVLVSINQSYDKLVIDWSTYDGCEGVSITLSLSNTLPVNLIPMYSNTYSNCTTKSTSYEIPSSFKVGILQVTVGSCLLLPIYLLNPGSYCRKGIYDLLIFIANPTNEGWIYSENTDFQSSNWNSSSLNQFETITSADDIKSSRYKLTEFKSYCFHLYENRWREDDDWFFVTPNSAQSLHFLFSVPGTQPCNIDYYNHVMGDQKVVSEGFHLKENGISLMFGFILVFNEDKFLYEGMGFSSIDKLGAFVGLHKHNHDNHIYNAETFGFHDSEYFKNKSFVREDSDCGSLSFGDCGIGMYQSYCKVKGISANIFCPSIPACNITCKLPEAGPDIIFIVDINQTTIQITIGEFPDDLMNNGKLDSVNPYSVKCKQSNSEKIISFSGKNVTVDNLESYTNYSFSIAVKSQFGLGAYGKEFNHRTAEDVPAGFPQNFTVKTINYSSLLLSWNDVEQNLWKGDIINYTFVCSNLQKNTTSFGQTPLYNGILYSLLPGTDYNCTVAACTKVGCGGYTPCFLVKTLPGIPQASAEIINASYINSTSILVEWKEILLELWVIIENREYCVEIQNSNYVRTQCVNISIYSLIFDGLQPYTSYTVLVYGKNQAGNGTKELSKYVVVQTDQAGPKVAPKNLTFENIDVNSMVFKWVPLTQSEYYGIIEGYSILVKADVQPNDYKMQQKRKKRNADFLNLSLEWQINIRNATATSFNITNLYGNTTYIVNISANTKYQGVFSITQTKARTLVGVPLYSLVNLVCCNATFNSLTVCWEHTPRLYLQGERKKYTGYHKSSGKENQSSLSPDSQQYIVNSLDPFTNYQLFVSASTEAGEGKKENVNCSTNEYIPTAPPLDFKVNALNHSSLLLSWDAVVSDKQNGIILRYEFSCTNLNLSSNVSLANNVTFQGIVNHLKPGTVYNCTVAACTKVGCGVQAQESNKTKEGIPQVSAKINYASYVNSSSIFFEWDDITTDLWVITKDRKFCIDVKSVNNMTILYVNYSSGKNNLTIHGLQPYTNYTILVYGKNEAGFGIKELSKSTVVTTDQLPPAVPPKNVAIIRVSVSEMVFQWTPLNKSEYFGVIEGYTIQVEAAVQVEDYMLPEQFIHQVPDIPVFNKSWVINISNADATTYSLKYLFGNTAYMISISANTKYQGVFSSRVKNTTNIGVPIFSVILLSCCENTSDSLTICWQHTPSVYLQGVRTAYTLYYRKFGDMQIKNDSLPVLSVKYLAFPLEPLTSYNFTVTASTTAGEGKGVSISCTTDESVPSKFPMNVTATSKEYPDGTTVSWNSIPKEYWRGQLLGYNLTYKLLEEGEKEVNQTWEIFLHSNLATSVVIRGLKIYSKYALKIAGYTRKGSGAFSTEVQFYTCNLINPEIEIEWILLEPFVMQPLLPGSSRPAGVMVESIEQSLLNCSGFCNSFFRNVTANFTYIDMNSTEFGDRNSTCIKFPVTTPKMFSIGQYAPTVNTPGFALLRIASSEQVALKENETKFVGNIKQALAVFLIYFLLNCLVGTLFFTIEHNTRNENLNCYTLFGVFEGIYLAMMTVTTVGYGDKVPVSFFGKLCIIIWAILGTVITGICVGNLSATLSITNIQTITMKYPKDNVVAKNGSPEYNWAVRKSFISLANGNFSTHKDVLNALKDGKAQYAIIEQYAVENYRQFMQTFKISVINTYKFQESSYGISLGENYSVLNSCMAKRLKTNTAQVDLEMSKLKAEMQRKYPAVAVKTKEKTIQMISPKAPVYQNVVGYLSAALLLLWIIGGVYEFVRRKRIRHKKNKVATRTVRKLAYLLELRDFYEEYRVGWAEMIKQFSKKTDDLLYKHNSELLRLTKKFSKMYGVNFKYVAFKDLGVPLETIAMHREEIKRRPKVSRLKKFQACVTKKVQSLRLYLGV